MRIHRLSVTAFGPFPGTVDLDLDLISASGLFLIHGPTGSGKTSLLDAICFALFSDVPGARDKKGLASQHAPAGTQPVVELELSSGSRRLRIRRTPAFERPKQRGTGSRTIPASVLLVERHGETWREVSTRPDEVAEVVDDVLGMGLEQFAKVCLLPQGDFAAFLRAKPDERRALLERLFDVSRFADVEAWLGEARRDAAREVEQARAALDTARLRLADVLVSSGLAGDEHDAQPVDGDEASAPDAPLPSDPSLSDPLLSEVLPSDLDRWAQRLDAAQTEALTRLDDAQAAERAAASALTAAESTAALQSKARAARSRQASVARSREARAVDRARLELAQRAEPARSPLDAVRAAESAQARADDDLRAARLAAPAHLRVAAAPATGVETSLLLDRLAGHDDGLARAGSHATRLIELEADLGRVRAQVAAAQRHLPEVEAELVAIGRVREGLSADLAEITATHDALPTLRAARDAAEARLAEHARLVEQRAHALVLREAAAAAHEQALDARRRLLEMHQQRLDGMAAELAVTLAEGEPCPVCGGVEHPTPAVPGAAAVTAEAVDAARAHSDVLDAAHAAAATAHAAAAARLAELERAFAGVGEADLDAALAAADRSLSEALARVARQARVELALAEAGRRADELGARADDLRSLLARAAGTVATLESESDTLARQVDAVLRTHADCPCRPGADDAGPPDDPHLPVDGTLPFDDTTACDGTTPFDDMCPPPDTLFALERPALRDDAARLAADLREMIAGHRAVRGSLTALHDAFRERDGAGTRLAEALASLTVALDQARVDGRAALETALIDAAQTRRLRDMLAGHDREEAAVAAVLDDAALLAAEQAEPPDLDALGQAAETARRSMLDARAAQSALERAARRFDELRPVVEQAATTLGPLAERSARLKDLADTVAGTGPGNARRMPLTSFVLAARLEKVVDLANQRLDQLGGGRYRLEHSDGVAARGARSGLGLRVLDQWTGQARDTGSLSGGEGFMASLALALGLADALRDESGGHDLATLFIDEGFGSLDDESLEQVLAVLDTLREGGRAVGVVSHVADLRDRVPDQVVVSKTTAGSTVATRAGVAEVA